MNQIAIWNDKSSFLGRFPTAEWHIHGAPVLFICLDGEFGIEFADGVNAYCSSAVVDAGVAHKTTPNGALMAVFYLAANSIAALQFKCLFFASLGYQLDVVKSPLGMKRLERALCSFDIELVLARRLPTIEAQLDQRVKQSLEFMHQSSHPQDRNTMAGNVHLSTSRFNHLFSQQLNVSYRRYRQWIQLGRAVQHYRLANNFAHAAQSAGFADAAHFTNTCKKLLGITPSSFLNKDTKFRVMSPV